jgi:hypothetical protein
MPKHKRKNTNVQGYGNQSVALCEKKNVYNRGYNGSFMGIKNPKAAVNHLVGAEDGMLEKVLTLCNENTVIAQNLVALVLASTLRPLAIMSLPGKKDKDDKKFASAHSIASGVIGFGFSSLIMSPFDKGAKLAKQSIQLVEAAEAFRTNGEGLTPKRFNKIKKAFKSQNLEDLKNSKAFNSIKEFLNVRTLEELESSKVVKDLQETFKVKSMQDLVKSNAFKNVTKVLDMAPDVFFFGVLKAVLTIKLIKPILKYVFGIEKSKPAQQLTPEQVKIKYGVEVAKAPNLTEFVGGRK